MMKVGISLQEKDQVLLLFIYLFVYKKALHFFVFCEFCFVEVRLSAVLLFNGATCLLQVNLFKNFPWFTVLFDNMELQLLYIKQNFI